MTRQIKEVTLEPLIQAEVYSQQPYLTKADIEAAILLALKQIRLNMDYFGTDFPRPATKDNCYPIMDNTEWTNGFWTGCLWLAYEYTGNDTIKSLAQANDLSFLERVTKDIELDHHDLGFLYSPLAWLSGNF